MSNNAPAVAAPFQHAQPSPLSEQRLVEIEIACRSIFTLEAEGITTQDVRALLHEARLHRHSTLPALALAESVYRQNCVADGEPSSVLDVLQGAIAKAEAR